MDRTVLIKIIRNDGKSMTFDGTDWKILELEGFGSFENDITVVDNAIGDGGNVASSRLSDKDRTIRLKSRNPMANDMLRRQVTDFFGSKFSYDVILTYIGLTRWFTGTIYKFLLPNGNVYRNMEMTLTFLCPDPYLRSKDNFGKNIAAITPMMAFPYLCSKTEGTGKGVTGGVFNFGRKVVLENDGKVDTYCKAVFTATGQVRNPRLIINGKYVRVIDVMVSGDTIIIDFTANPPTVRKNGENFIGHCDRTSEFDQMAFRIGSNVIEYDADDGTNQLGVSVYYNKLYETM